MKKVTIGLLLPSSTVIPMSRDFESGLKSILNTINKQQYDIELVSEFVAEGSKEKAEAAINKLSSFNQADIITGILSTRTLTTITEKFDKSKKTFLINNVGEHAPNHKLLSANLHINSTNLWQQVWSLGYWGVKQFGNKGMYVGGLYDSGYSFTSMLNLGMLAADKDAVMPFAVAPVQDMGQLADVKSVFQHIETYKPDFLFAAFCGEEASEFFSEYQKRGLTTPILGTGFLLQPFSSNGAPIKVYSTFSSYTSLNINDTEVFSEVMDNPFNSLGVETGLILKEAIETNEGFQKAKNLADVSVSSNRGTLHISSQSPGKTTKVYLVECTTTGNDVKKELGEELVTLSYHEEAYQHMLESPSSGWYNPYPGV